MIKSIFLLSCALTLGQTTDRAEWQLAPQLTPGLELVYVGTYIEESLIPSVQYQRHYRLNASLLVLDSGPVDWHIAILTSLSLHDPRQPLDKKRDGPTSVRLGQAKVDQQGRIRSLDKKLLEIPIGGPPTLETGSFIPAPLTRVGRNFTWDVTEEGRPVQHWQVLGTESIAGVACLKISGVQQSDDWDRSRADQTAWRRRDILWLLPQLNVAQKVERIIEQRAAARDAPTHRTIARHELESHVKYPGQFFEDRKQDVLKANKIYDDAQFLLRQPVLHRAQIDSMIQRVSYYLKRQESTPYRQAVLHVKTVLENAKKGESPVPHMAEELIQHTVKALDVGQQAPDCTVSSFTEPANTRLQSHRGKAILVFFYNPATPLGKEVLTYVKQLSEKQNGKLAVMAMAVTQDEDAVRKQHQEMRLTFPILDGNGMRLTFGAIDTPRFVLVDADGLVRLTRTGWGIQTPVEIEDQLHRCRKQ